MRVIHDILSAHANRNHFNRRISYPPFLGSNHISMNSTSQATTNRRNGNGFKGRGGSIAAGVSRRKYHRVVKQELKAEDRVDSPSGLDTKPIAKRRRSAKAQENSEPAKMEKIMDPAGEGVKSVGERVGADNKSVENSGEGSNKREREKRNTRQQSCKAESVRKIPKRMVEKAALIVQVMDTLYPDPPIPLNHTVRLLRQMPTQQNTCSRFILIGVCLLAILSHALRLSHPAMWDGRMNRFEKHSDPFLALFF